MTTMILIIMFILGFLYAKLVESVKQKLKNKRLLTDGFNQFKEILENIYLIDFTLFHLLFSYLPNGNVFALTLIVGNTIFNS